MKYFLLLLFPFTCAFDFLGAAVEETPNCLSTKKTTHVHVAADLLYWVPEVSGLDTNFGSGSVSQTTTDGVTKTISTETDRDPTFNWHVGYRLALGCQFDQNRWELGGLWTDFQGSAHASIDHGKWRVRLYQLDVTALYNSCLGSSFTFQPFFGLRGTSIRQKLFSRVVTHITFTGSGSGSDTRTFHDREQFYGLGPLFGCSGDYAIKYGLGIYANIGAALLYGNYHLRFHDSEVVTEPATPTHIRSSIKKDMKAFDFSVDLGVGVRLEYLISNACYVIMKLGFENHQYFDQSRLGDTYGNLSFSGGVFSLGLDF